MGLEDQMHDGGHDAGVAFFLSVRIKHIGMACGTQAAGQNIFLRYAQTSQLQKIAAL